jgi:acetylornithine deacetylase/succinyl-diaminopimelate desuccinylase-like protein
MAPGKHFYLIFMENYKKLLKEFISFKSISTDAQFKSGCYECAEWLSGLFRKNSFSVKFIENEHCNPVVFASYDIGAEETVCVYGHYDVQPTDGQPWANDPFDVFEDQSYIYARGVVDNKGQVLIHIANVFEAIKNNTLTKNVLFVIEGNEESGNPALPQILKENLPKNIDYTIISDGEIVQDHPTIESSLRGGANMKIILKTANSDTHSGLFGGAVPNAGYELSLLLPKIKEKNKITIPEFYKDISVFPDVATPSSLNIDPVGLISSFGMKDFVLEQGRDFYEQVGQYPTISITGINSGYTGAGFANIVPSVAEARLNIRIVAGQDINKILLNLEKFLKENVPEYVELYIEKTEGYDPILLDINTDTVNKIEQKLENAFSNTVLYKFVGGGIPIVNDFIEITQKPVILVSLGNEDCNMHGHDEKFKKDILEKSFAFSEDFWTSK